jgi:uncharacterized protein YaaR (DUF327 family)
MAQKVGLKVEEKRGQTVLGCQGYQREEERLDSMIDEIEEQGIELEQDISVE